MWFSVALYDFNLHLITTTDNMNLYYLYSEKNQSSDAGTIKLIPN